MGIEILPPDVNLFDHEFVVVDGNIRFGLDAVKGVGFAAVEAMKGARQETEDLVAEKPINDVLNSWFRPRVIIKVKKGDEIAVAVQFFSPTNHKVAANMAIKC